MTDLQALFADLAAEGTELDTLVAGLNADQWRGATAAPGWTVAHQISHLAWTDQVATLAATDPTAFAERVEEALRAPTSFADTAAEEGALLPSADLLAEWRSGRLEMLSALADVPAGRKLPWFGPPMSAASMATARLMETWAHGQDIVDGLALSRQPTARLRHVAHIGVRTVGFAFTLHDLPVPTEPFHIELTAPDGESWTWGAPDAADRISCTALDFCLLVTQRRHPDDLTLDVHGAQAQQWVPIAQAFAGLPGEGRKAGQFQ
ncbi:MAG TPA: TIGR03084 family metal-binding protein [Pseudonocardiaceae bacterium]|nr:TIGR03084 family metal-binding protein [Pseudonocardiaceae bacterium]